MDNPHIVLQTIRHTPLDEFAVIIYLFVLYILATATFRRPIWGLCGLFLIEPFALYRDVGPTTLTLPKVAILAVVIGLVLRRPPISRLVDRRTLPLLLAGIAITATTALSVFWADFKAPALREALKAAEYVLVFALSLLCYYMDPDRRILRGCLFLVTLIVSLLSLSQEFTTAPAGMWISYGHAVPRIAGPLEGPNQLSAYLGLMLPILVAFLIERATIVDIAIVGIAVITDLLTISRAGVTSTVIAVLVVLFVLRARNVKLQALGLILPAAIGLALLVLAGGEVRHFFSPESQYQPSGLGTRSDLWTGAYRLWRSHPLLGVGAGNYELELGRVGFPDLHTHSNSAYIQAITEGGIPLFASVIALTYFSIFQFRRSRQPLVVGIFGAMIGMAVHQFLDYLLFYPKVGVLYWAFLGIAVAALLVTPTPVAEQFSAEKSDLNRMPEPALS